MRRSAAPTESHPARKAECARYSPSSATAGAVAGLESHARERWDQHPPRRSKDQHTRERDHQRRGQLRKHVGDELCAIRDSHPYGQRVHWQGQHRTDWRMAVIEVTADVEEVIRKKLVAGLLLEHLRDEFI